MKLLACVKEIHDLEVVLSLPDMLNATLGITEVSSIIRETVERVALASNDESDDDEEEVCSLKIVS